jgi:Tfp pilus assembly protein PilX
MRKEQSGDLSVVRRRAKGFCPSGDSGQVLVGAITALLIIAIFMPLIVKYVQQESRWAIKQRQTTNAFHLAEAGIDRGIWKLTESDQNWEDAKSGVAIAGYADDVEYADMSGGKYKIKFSSGPDDTKVTIIAKGRDSTTNEMRAIEAVYTKAAIQAGLNVEGGLQYKPNLHVHWGPVVTYTSIDQSPSDYYPRKFSKGQIVGRDTVNDSNNTDNVEYWAFYPDLGDAPEVDLDYYKSVAQKSQIPLTTNSPKGRLEKNSGGNNLAVATPTGSGYFLASQNSNSGLRFEKDGGGANYYEFKNSTSVIYIDNDTGGAIITDLQNGGAFVQLAALILAGNNHNLDINAQEGVVGATVPAAAGEEYMHSSLSSYNWPGKTAPGAGNCCYTLSSLAAHGFVYVGGNVNNAGSNTQILGVLDVIGDVSVNTLYVYYDKEVANGIKVKGGSPRRVSWREIKTTW